MSNSGSGIAEEITNGFREKSLELLKSSYRKMRAEGDCSRDWDEEDISKELYRYMDEEVLSEDYPCMDVEWEVHHISDETDQVGRIDLKIKQLGVRSRIYFFLECKLLDESSDKIYKYRREGVLRFISGKYAEKYNGGMMVGYLISDERETIIEELSDKIESDENLMTEDSLTVEKREENILRARSLHERENDMDKLNLTHMLLQI